QLWRRWSLSGSQDHQETSNVAFWCTSRKLLLILSKAGNLINKVRISLCLCTYRINAIRLGSLMSLAFLNKHHKSQFILQHRFGSSLVAQTPRFAFAAKRLQAPQK
ncbi:hypothetical protein N321_13468, partial [Antrostomus carolinensis]